jgi:hypothetical protein
MYICVYIYMYIYIYYRMLTYADVYQVVTLRSLKPGTKQAKATSGFIGQCRCLLVQKYLLYQYKSTNTDADEECRFKLITLLESRASKDGWYVLTYADVC